MVEPGRYSLLKGVPVQVSSDARLTLVAVEDSRCPDGVQCIWAGRIVYQFELSTCGQSERFSLTPADAAARQDAKQSAPSHTLALAPAMQVALAGGEIPPRGSAPVSPVHSVDVIIGPN
ncbi:MAG TPA: hypothetical protein VGE60_09385 [Telluria sp.]